MWTFAACNILLTASMIVLFSFSDAPFCSGAYGTVSSCLMSLSLRNSVNFLFVYLVHRSLLRTFTVCPVSLSIWAVYYLNVSNNSGFVFRHSITLYPKESSLNRMKYLAPPTVGVLIGPQRSICTRSPRNANRSLCLFLENRDLCCFPYAHPRQNFLSFSVIVSPSTSPWLAICSMVSWFAWDRCWCQTCRVWVLSTLVDIPTALAESAIEWLPGLTTSNSSL
jgi:hypothetical protein